MGKGRAITGLCIGACAVAGCLDATGTPREVFALAEGTVHTVDGTDPSGLWAIWEPAGGGRPDSAVVASDGSFRIELTTEAASGALIVDGAGGRYHPFLFPFTTSSASPIDLVLVPTRWTIRRGEYRGTSVPTPLDLVVDDDADRTFFTYFRAQPYPRPDADRFFLDLVIRPDTLPPARVAIDHRNSERPLVAADSTALWQVLDRLEAVLGQDLFEPVEADTTWWPTPTGPFDGAMAGVIRLTAQAPGWRAILHAGDDPDPWDYDLGPWSAGGRFEAFREARRDNTGGTVVLGAFEPFRLADGLVPWETVFMHEVIHLLGVGHTCRMESPMGPCARTAEPSVYDVAYLELLQATLRLQDEVGTPYGLMPAIIGERRVALGLPALPSLDGGA